MVKTNVSYRILWSSPHSGSRASRSAPAIAAPPALSEMQDKRRYSSTALAFQRQEKQIFAHNAAQVSPSRFMCNHILHSPVHT